MPHPEQDEKQSASLGVFDASGIPIWETDADGYDFHHDERQMLFGAVCESYGLDLPDFDRWLSAMHPCGAKLELLERRENALLAFEQSKGEDSILRHLEWMMLRRRYIKRSNFLLPLAKKGNAQITGGREGGLASRITRNGPDSKKAKVIELAKENPNLPIHRIASAVPCSEAYVRQVLRKSKL